MPMARIIAPAEYNNILRLLFARSAYILSLLSSIDRLALSNAESAVTASLSVANRFELDAKDRKLVDGPALDDSRGVTRILDE